MDDDAFFKYFMISVTRVYNENMMLRSFIPYYLSQGVDRIYLLDDNSTEPFEDWVLSHPNVEIQKVRQRLPEWSSVERCLTEELRKKTKWVITVDSDEFIHTRRNPEKTIREEMETTFKFVSCVKIPWLMFTRNKRVENPKDVIMDTVWRWSQDKRHPPPKPTKKFGCRKEQMEVKCIWRASHYRQMHCHYPCKCCTENEVVVSSVDMEPDGVEPWRGTIYKNLTEKKVENAWMLCNHYRIVSEEHAKGKCYEDSCTLYTNKAEENILENALLADYPDVKDLCLRNKYEKILSRVKTI
ncbi:MAG: hypothetical protein CMF80_07895 [Candidatus Marinimicrobia bacterium]|nr:hypothetical protein [Candidatus Neomarinimicrobiota bacterium]